MQTWRGSLDEAILCRVYDGSMRGAFPLQSATLAFFQQGLLARLAPFLGKVLEESKLRAMEKFLVDLP